MLITVVLLLNDKVHTPGYIHTTMADDKEVVMFYVQHLLAVKN